jgi:hypothetical protein
MNHNPHTSERGRKPEAFELKRGRIELFKWCATGERTVGAAGKG